MNTKLGQLVKDRKEIQEQDWLNQRGGEGQNLLSEVRISAAARAQSTGHQ